MLLRHIKLGLVALTALVGATSCLDKYPDSAIPEKRCHADVRRRRTAPDRHLRTPDEQRSLQRLPHAAARHPVRPGLCRRRQLEHLRRFLALEDPSHGPAHSGRLRPALRRDRRLQLLPRPDRRGDGPRDQRRQPRNARPVHGRGLRHPRALLFGACSNASARRTIPPRPNSSRASCSARSISRRSPYAAPPSTIPTSSCSTT